MARPRDKLLEQHYVEFCARALGVDWTILNASEAPDFLIAEGDAAFGLEVTRMFQDTGQAVGGSGLRRREGVAQKSMRRIREAVEQQTGVTFSVTFAQRPREAEEAQIAAELVALGLQHQPLWSVADFRRPNGSRIVARRTEHPHWCIVSDSAGWVDRQGHVQLQHCVAEKSPWSRTYGGPGVSDLRLLVVADAVLNSGKVVADPNVCIDLMGFARIYLAAYPKDVIAYPSIQPYASI